MFYTFNICCIRVIYQLLKLLEYSWNIYFVSIDAGAQVAVMLLAFGPCVVIVYGWDRLCTLGRAPRTKETLPDFS